MKAIVFEEKDRARGVSVITELCKARHLNGRHYVPNSVADELKEMGIGYREVSIEKFQKDWARLYKQGNLEINALSEIEIELKTRWNKGYGKPDDLALRLFQERMLHQSLESYKIEKCGYVKDWMSITVLSEKLPEETSIRDDVWSSAAGLNLEYKINFIRPTSD